MKNEPRKTPPTGQKTHAAANDTEARTLKLAELRRRGPKASDKTIEIVCNVTHPEMDPHAELGADDRPHLKPGEEIAGQFARREARHELMKLTALEYPKADWNGVWQITSNKWPELFGK